MTVTLKHPAPASLGNVAATGASPAGGSEVTTMCHMLPIVLIQPEIPHNTGAIGRLCVGLDAALHLIRPLGFHLTNRWIQRAGLDYWQHLDLHIHADWEAFLAAVQPQRLVISSTRGERSIYDCRFRPGDVLVFGNESSGLPAPFYARYRRQLARIPMPGPHARSINLANAVAITAYEAWRQIRPHGAKRNADIVQ